ncbi:MAG: carboxypeptidase-like regulatory domain-containing protein, partial [Planctomycetota bacterium]
EAQFELTGLSPGSYTLEVIAEGCGPARRQIEVMAEEEARVKVALASGGSIGLAFAGETDEPLGVAVALRVRDADGVLFFDETLEPEENGYVSRWIFAPHGTLQVEASLADGRKIEVELPFASGASSAPNLLRFE